MKTKYILKITILFSVFFTSFGILHSCSCAGEAYFCQEINDTTDAFLHPDFVFQGIKLQDTLHGMFVKIEKQYINEIFEDTILIWGDPGHLCRVYTSNFEIGDTIILGIKLLDVESGMPEESIGDYWFPACGVTFLRVENGIVEGAISMGLDAISLEDFDLYMDNKDYESECSITSNKNQYTFGSTSLKFYPNPTTDFAYISFENIAEIEHLTVYNSNGQVKNVRFVMEEKLIRLYLGDLEKGIYFIKLKSGDNFQTYKFIVI